MHYIGYLSRALELAEGYFGCLMENAVGREDYVSRARALEHIGDGDGGVAGRDGEERAAGPHNTDGGDEVSDRVCMSGVVSALPED